MEQFESLFFFKFRNITLLWKIIGTFDQKKILCFTFAKPILTYVKEDFQNPNIYFLKIALYNKKKNYNSLWVGRTAKFKKARYERVNSFRRSDGAPPASSQQRQTIRFLQADFLELSVYFMPTLAPGTPG